jgi:hypothetical protein
MAVVIALLVAAALLLGPAAGLEIRQSSGPSKFAGGLVRDPTYVATQ